MGSRGRGGGGQGGSRVGCGGVKGWGAWGSRDGVVESRDGGDKGWEGQEVVGSMDGEGHQTLTPTIHIPGDGKWYGQWDGGGRGGGG